jgi:hypothetical protein
MGHIIRYNSVTVTNSHSVRPNPEDVLETNYSGECEIKLQWNGNDLHNGQSRHYAYRLRVYSGWVGLVCCMDGKEMCLQNFCG